MFRYIYLLIIIIGISYGFPSSTLDSRIIGGQDTPSSYAPHAVALISQTYFTSAVCGGSIISKRSVLTAAHCITPFAQNGSLAPNFWGRVGSKIWHSGGTVVHFETYHIHPQWDPELIKYDLGVLIMEKDLVLSDDVAVIDLNFGWVGGGHSVSATGWGITAPRFDEISVDLAPRPYHLQFLHKYTLSPQQCALAMARAREHNKHLPPVKWNIEICTFHSVGHGMCNGDSGSGLLSIELGKLIGVVSWGNPCAVGAPDVFVRLSGMTGFLRNYL